MAKIKLGLVPQRAALLEHDENVLHVLLRASAPDGPKPDSVRPDLNIAIVIDRSGSMSGRPLDEAKRCARMMVDNMKPTDLVSLVTYDDKVSILVPPQSALDKSPFHAALRQVESGGMTDLHGGWLKGAELAALGANGRPLSRVLLLSDGQANKGLTNPDRIARHCSKMADAGVSTSTYGLGEGFNEDLMTAMARSGIGNAYYGRSAEDLMDPFRQEFDLLSALCGRSLRLALAPASGVRVDVVNGYRIDAEGRTMLPDIAYGSEAWAMLRLSVPREVLDSIHGDPLYLLTAALSYVDLDGTEHSADAVHLKLPRLRADRFAAMATDEMVGRRISELRSADLQEEARLAARRHDWEHVDRLLAQLQIEAKDNAWLAASIVEIERYARGRETEKFSKEVMYKSGIMRSRLSAADEAADYAEKLEGNVPSYLRRKVEQGRRFPTDEDSPDGTTGPTR